MFWVIITMSLEYMYFFKQLKYSTFFIIFVTTKCSHNLTKKKKENNLYSSCCAGAPRFHPGAPLVFTWC